MRIPDHVKGWRTKLVETAATIDDAAEYVQRIRDEIKAAVAMIDLVADIDHIATQVAADKKGDEAVKLQAQLDLTVTFIGEDVGHAHVHTIPPFRIPLTKLSTVLAPIMQFIVDTAIQATTMYDMFASVLSKNHTDAAVEKSEGVATHLEAALNDVPFPDDDDDDDVKEKEDGR